MASKKVWIISGIIIITVALGFFAFWNNEDPKSFLAENGIVNCGDYESCLKDNLISCNSSKFSTRMMIGEYNITVLGVEEEKCHFKMYVNYIHFDCLYSLEETNEELYNHLFVYDMTNSTCSSEACVRQQKLMSKNCVKSAS